MKRKFEEQHILSEMTNHHQWCDLSKRTSSLEYLHSDRSCDATQLEKSIVIPGEDTQLPVRAAPLKMKGELRLSIDVIEDRLTVHVIQARHLSSRWKSLCDSYVQVLLIPRQTDEECPQTDVVYASNNPSFEEKFTYELMEGDKRKRLMVSMWHKDSDKKCSEFMGCMSFGMKHLMCKRKEKKTDGWYYLLSENVGHRKHLLSQACDEKQKTAETSSSSSSSVKSIALEDCLTIVIKKSLRGFGFTLRGSRPIRVGRVKKMSAGHQAGLQKGDYIVAVNDQDMLESTAEQAAQIVRHSAHQVVLSVHRPSNRVACHNSPTSCHNEQPGTACSKNDNRSPNQTRSQPSSEELDMSEEEEYGSWNSHDRTIWQPSMTQSLAQSQTMWDPSLSAISPAESMASLSDTSSGCGASVSRPSSIEDGCSRSRGNSTGVSSADDDEEYGGMPQPHSWRHSGVEHESHTQAIHQLLACEQEFVAEMQHGILRFSRPLRHCIVSSQQHVKIFQNIEKLVAISEFHVAQLLENSYHDNLRSAGDTIMDSIGDVYKPKIKILCAAYGAYKNGLQTALDTLSALRDYKQLRHFLKNPSETSDHLSIEDFLHRPLQHIQDLFVCLENILMDTSTEHPSHSSLNEIVQVLSGTCNTLFGDWDKSQSIVQSACSSKMSRRSALDTSMVSLSSVDSEVMELQQRLKFAKGIKPFQIATASRHMIFSGQLLLVHGASCQRLNAQLLSDLLLLTWGTPDKQLVVIEEPLLLHDIIRVEFDCDHACEFMLTFDHLRTTSSIRREAKHYTFRAANMEEKCAWKTILEHRVRVCKSQREHPTWPTNEVFI